LLTIIAACRIIKPLVESINRIFNEIVNILFFFSSMNSPIVLLISCCCYILHNRKELCNNIRAQARKYRARAFTEIRIIIITE